MKIRILTLFLAGVLIAGAAVAGAPRRALAGESGLTYWSVSSPLAPASAPHVLGPYYALIRDFALQSRLGLSSDQMERIRDLLDENAKAQIALSSDLLVRQVELRQLLEEDTLDIKSIDKAVDAINGYQASMLKSEIHTVVKACAVLTAEQNAVLQGAVRGPGR